MATTTYYPNTANSTAYGGASGNLPSGLLDLVTRTELTGTQKNTVSTDDDNNHIYSQTLASYTGHQLVFKIAEAEGSVTDLALTAKGSGDRQEDATKYWGLYLWNYSTSAYELQDSHTTFPKATLTSSIVANCPNYIDVDGYINYTLYSPVRSMFGNYARSLLYYATLVVTYSAGGPKVSSAWICRDSGLCAPQRRSLLLLGNDIFRG